MGQYKSPPLVKLVIGLLGKNPDILASIRGPLKEKFGPEEEIMTPIPFIWTNYYAQEVGDSPWRTFISYETRIPRETMVDIKRYTNDLEAEFSQDGMRPVNIDPGYMTLGQFFLATTKDQRQRVYIRDGIFVEPTLFFQEGRFMAFDWTYPDYRSEQYQDYLAKVRGKLAYQHRHSGLPFSTTPKRKRPKQENDSGKPPSPGKGQGEGESD